MPINVNTNLRKAHIHGMISILPAKDRVGRSESALLKLIHASKIYAKNGICALNAVDLTVQDGDYISVTGASGSGKSTLMHILGLLDSLTEGEYLLDGAAVAHLPAKQRAGTIGSGVPSARTSSAVLPKARALVCARKLPRKSSWTSWPSSLVGLGVFTKAMKSAGMARVPW